MNLFLLMLLIPLSFAGSPPDCKRLGTILQDYEKDLQKKHITQCNQLKPEMFVKDIPVKDPKFLEGKVCFDLASIESQLETLKNEQAVLSGLEKLKATLHETKQDTAAKNPSVARVAGMSFVNSLNTAESLEILLQTTLSDGSYVIQKLKEFPEYKRLTQKDLSDRLSEICKEESKSGQTACNPKVFKPGPEASKEILEMVKNTNPSTEQISKWQGMLAIKKKGAEESYSFHEMQKELSGAFDKIDKNEVMSKRHLLAIQKLDDFENAKGLSFVEDIASIKDNKKAKIASDRFFLLIGDAKLRQQYEVQSKISVVWDNMRGKLSGLNDSQIADCDNAKLLFTMAKSCENHLREANRNVGDKNLLDFLSAIKTSIDYADNLESKEKSCEAELRSKGSLSETCFGEMNKDLATVQDQILQLNILKDKIGSENIDLMKYRNFALYKWGDQKCQTVSSTMDLCDEVDSPETISKNALMTVSDTMKVAIAFTPPPKSEEEVKELCEDEDKKKKSSESALCDFFNDTTSNIVQTNNHPDGPVEAPDGGNADAQVKDAWLQAGTNILKDVLGAIMQQNTPQGVYPYPYNYSPYNFGNPPMGISDSILFNARYHGAYGFYMPTPGYQPYNAFPTSSFTYRSVSTPTSKYFNF